MGLGGSRASVLAAAVFLSPACALVSGLEGLERTSGVALDGSAGDGPSASDALTEASVLDAATESAVDTGIDTGRLPTYVDAVLADNPIAYYRLDETSGAVVTSDVTGAPNGTFTRGVTLGTASPVTKLPSNRAATFALSALNDSDLRFGDNFGFPGDSHFTIEVWVNPTTVDGVPRHIFSKADRVSNTPVNGWNICLETMGGGLATATMWVERCVTSAGLYTAKVPIVVGTFTHVVAVYNGTLILYLNGARVASAIDGRMLPATTTQAFAGSAEGLNGHGFLGQLDELAIYNKPLTAAQIATHYAAGKP